MEFADHEYRQSVLLPTDRLLRRQAPQEAGREIDGAFKGGHQVRPFFTIGIAAGGVWVVPAPGLHDDFGEPDLGLFLA